MFENKWTIYIKSLRAASGFTLKTAAEMLHVSAPYLHDVEMGNRTPTRKLVSSIIELYNLGDEAQRIIYDAAAEVLGSLPFDVEDFLKSNPDAMQTVINMMSEKKHQL